jgi:ribosome-associated translation inhibitor RaiA
MVKFDADSLAVDQKEVTAFIQQQMLDLAPHLDEKSALQIRLKQVKNGFEAELTASQKEGEIQTVGWHEDIYSAIRNAKEGLLQYFVEVEEQLNPMLREEKIKYLRQHGSLYLH